MLTVTPGQAFVMVLVFFGMVIVILWGLIAGELERQERRDKLDSARRLRRELERQQPPRWQR